MLPQQNNRNTGSGSTRASRTFALLALVALAITAAIVGQLGLPPGGIAVLLLAVFCAACGVLAQLWCAGSRLPDAHQSASRLLQSAPDGILTINARGQVLSMNPTAERFFGYTAAEMIGQPISQLLGDPPTQVKQNFFRETMPIGSILGLAAGAREVIGKRKNGETFALELTGQSIRIGDENISVAFARDISKRKRAQRYLTAHFAVTCILAEAPNPSGVLLRILQAICEALGWEAGAYWALDNGLLNCTRCYRLGIGSVEIPSAKTCVPGEGLAGRALTKELPVLVEDISQQQGDPCAAMATQHNLRGALAFPILDGRLSYGVMTFFTSDPLRRDDQLQDIIGELGRQLGQFMSRKRDQEQLRQTTELLQALVQAAPVGISMVDRQGKVQLWNPAAERIFGWTPQEVLDRPLCLDTQPVGNALRGIPGEDQGQPTRCRKKDGGWVEVNLWTAPLVDAARSASGVMSILMDLTEQKQLEERLRQAQKMEAVGQLAGGVAHDFNNLLTVINGFSELLLSQITTQPERHLVEQVMMAGDRASALTRQLLAFARKQHLQPRVLDLNTTVGELGTMLRRLIGENFKLVINTDPLLRRVKADPGQIEQILMNLATNARDAMESGGVLTISTLNYHIGEQNTPSGDVTCSEVPPGWYVLIRVSDTGCGMTNKVKAQIFEPFFTTKEQGKGTGLGLAMVYGIVKQSRGHIEIDSEPGQGTTFRIYLPALDTDAFVCEEPQTLQPLAHPRGNETILLVEDEDAVRRLLCEILRKDGYRVLEASCGEEALRLAEAHRRISLLVTDVIMPRMNGRQLADQLAKSRPALKILYMSGYTEQILEGGQFGQEAGFLSKPLTRSMLTRKVRELLDAPGGSDHTNTALAPRSGGEAQVDALDVTMSNTR